MQFCDGIQCRIEVDFLVKPSEAPIEQDNDFELAATHRPSISPLLRSLALHVAGVLTDVLAGFVLARASAGLTDSTIRNDTNCGISRGFLRGFQPAWNGLDQVFSGPWCLHPRDRITRIPRKS
jgi:hypothetical protein